MPHQTQLIGRFLTKCLFDGRRFEVVLDQAPGRLTGYVYEVREGRRIPMAWKGMGPHELQVAQCGFDLTPSKERRYAMRSQLLTDIRAGDFVPSKRGGPVETVVARASSATERRRFDGNQATGRTNTGLRSGCFEKSYDH